MNQQPATSTSALPPPLALISDNLQYSDFLVIQKFHFYRASLRHTLFFFFVKCRLHFSLKDKSLQAKNEEFKSSRSIAMRNLVEKLK
jgi:hypothetical protein